MLQGIQLKLLSLMVIQRAVSSFLLPCVFALVDVGYGISSSGPLIVAVHFFYWIVSEQHLTVWPGCHHHNE